MKIAFSGSSDDIIEIMCPDQRIDDEIGAFNCQRFMKIEAPNGDGLIVFAQYANGTPDGTWTFGITLLGEDKPLPKWPICFSTDANGYSPILTLDVPEGTTMTVYRRGGDRDA